MRQMGNSTSLRLDEFCPWRTITFVSSDTLVSLASTIFLEHLMRSGTSNNTIAAFSADLRLFQNFLPPDTKVASVTPEDINRFYEYLVHGRDVPCSSRSLRRRATTLAAFFRYLIEANAIDRNPCLSVRPTLTPVRPPQILTDEEISRLMAAARTMLHEGEPRALLLLALVLSTGIRKSECLALRLEDFDLTQDTVTVGEGNSRRELPLPPNVKQALLAFASSTEMKHGRLFACTGRNLEYILARVGREAGLSVNPSFRLLRAAAAAQMYAQSQDADAVIQQLGISPHTWPALRRRLVPARQTTEPKE